MRAALVGCAALMALAGPPVASAAEKSIWGPLDLPDGRSAFPVYERLGVDTLQMSMSFASVAPTRPEDVGDPKDPAYDWPQSIDAAIAEGRAHGVEVALLVSDSPGWANGGRSVAHVPDSRAFAKLVAAASRRYPSVRKWMIWGEPNRADQFQPNSINSPRGPRAYAKILDAAYGALKRVSRRNTVIGGMTFTAGTVRPGRWLTLMRLPNGRPPRLDWFGHNPFPIRFPDLREEVMPGFRDISDLDDFGRQLRRTYGRDARFWLSEFTVQSEKPSKTFAGFVSRREQAQWLTAAYRIADRLRSVAGLGWIRLVDATPREGDERWGLLDARGRRKPSYRAYRAAPSSRHRPRVRAPRSVSRRWVARRGVRVRVRQKVGGRLIVTLRSRSGRVLRGVRRRAVAGRSTSVRLRRSGLRPGRYRLEVAATRGERVRRRLTLR